MSSAAPPLPSLAPVSFSRPPAPLPLAPPVSAPSVVAGPSLPLPPVSQLGGGLYALGSAQVLAPAPSGGAPLSASSALLSVPPSAVPSSSLSFSRPQGVSVLSPHSSSLLPSAPVAWPVSAAPPLGSSLLVSVAPRLPSVFLLTLFHPGSAAGPPVLSVASAPPPFCCASLGFAAGPSGFASSSADCMFGFTGSAPQPGPSAAFPSLSGPSVAPSAPPLSNFDYGPEDPFAPGFGDHDASGAEAPAPPPLSDSARAEVRRMYQYLVDLFPQSAGTSQAPLPPRALLEEFFAAPSPHQPVFLSWFERVRSTLSDADARIVSLLASGRQESSLLPPRQSRYSVGCSSSLGSAAPVNPSLLAMFERSLGPSLHLGLTLREAFILESSSRALSEAQSHAMWLLSGLLGFACLQGFSPSDSLLFNTSLLFIQVFGPSGIRLGLAHGFYGYQAAAVLPLPSSCLFLRHQ